MAGLHTSKGSPSTWADPTPLSANPPGAQQMCKADILDLVTSSPLKTCFPLALKPFYHKSH